MKYTVILAAVLSGLVGLVILVARGPVAQQWGAAGVTSLYAASGISLSAALVAAVLAGVTLHYRREYAAVAALGGSAVRLLMTMTLGVAYQMFFDVDKTSFLACLLVLYLLLLAAETVLCVILIVRTSTPRPSQSE